MINRMIWRCCRQLGVIHWDDGERGVLIWTMGMLLGDSHWVVNRHWWWIVKYRISSKSSKLNGNAIMTVSKSLVFDCDFNGGGQLVILAISELAYEGSDGAIRVHSLFVTLIRLMKKWFQTLGFWFWALVLSLDVTEDERFLNWILRAISEGRDLNGSR